MTRKKACIYCGNENDLSESDIIPDALTNARITNKNVCRVEHNNKFSDLFESKVISSFAFITNELGIKSSKGKNYASYDATVKIEGIDFETQVLSEKELLNGRVLKSVDEKYLVGSIDRMLQIENESRKIEIIETDKLVLDKTVNINLEIYFDEAIFRMVAKIAFEWYCAKNDVSGYHEDFKDIISFIVTGNGKNPVTIIENKHLYDMVGEHANLGSHCLFGLQDSNGKVNIILSLFGVVMYRVIVAEHKPIFCQKNLLFLELCTDSSRKEFTEISREHAHQGFVDNLRSQSFIPGPQINGLKTMLLTSSATWDVGVYIFLLGIIDCLNLNIEETISSNERINSTLINQILQIVQAFSIHKKSIKRFVNEYFSDGHAPIVLNPAISNKKNTVFFYILMAVGNSGIKTIDDQKFRQVVDSALEIPADSEINIDDFLEKKLKLEIIETPNYSEILEYGANTIKNWIN